jgi:hypothetical protein
MIKRENRRDDEKSARVQRRPGWQQAGPGRPRHYSPDVAEELLDRLSAGESLESICRDEHMPAPPTVRKWAAQRVEEEDGAPSFSAEYARAREFGYDAMAERLLDFGLKDYVGPDGYVDNGEIQRLRLLSDNRRWLLSKLLPRKYGDKVTQEITGQDGSALITRIELVAVDPRPREQIEHDDGTGDGSASSPRKKR